MTPPHFPSGSLMISCSGTACIQEGKVIHEGIIPSHSLTACFQPQKRVSIIVPEQHNAVRMIKASKAFCVNILPASMIHDSLHPQVTSPLYVETIEDTGLTTTACSYINAQRFLQAAVAIECVVEHYVLLDGFILIQASMISTHYHDKTLARLKPKVEQHTTQQEA